MLPALSIGFIVGLMLGSYLPLLPFSAMLILLAMALVTTALERRAVVAASLGLTWYIGVLAGVLYWTATARPPSGILQGEQAGSHPVRIEGTVVEPVHHAAGRVVLLMDATRLGDQPMARVAPVRLRITWRDPDQVPFIGDTIAVVGKVRRQSGTHNPGGFDFETYLARKGIDGVVSVTGAGQVEIRRGLSSPVRLQLWRIVEEWRERVRQAALHTLTGPALGVFLGLIVGESDYVSPQVRDDFMTTGTVHILSISGSHLGLIAVLGFFVIKGLCRRLPGAWFLTMSRWVTPTQLAAALTALPVTFYTLLAGAEIATARSLIMILLFLAAVWLGRENAILVTVCSAAIVLLLLEPRAIFDISFQLSFVSVTAIGLALRRLKRPPDLPPEGGWHRGERVRRWLRDYCWIGGSVTLATIPLVALYFNQIAWLGLAANLLVVPFAGFVLVPVGLLSAVGTIIGGADHLPAGGLNQWLGERFVDSAGLLARIPGAEWHVSSPAIPVLVLFYAFLIYALAAAPARWSWRQAVCAAGLILIVGWWAWSPRGGADGESLLVTFLDVGQGDAALVELPDGGTVLIDGGAAYDTVDFGRAVVAPYLWDRGIRRLDHVVATHPQLDHIGGLVWIVRKFEVALFWSNGVARREPFFEQLQNALRARHVPEARATEGETLLSSDGCRLIVLNPPPIGRDRAPDDRRGQDQGPLSGSELNNLSVATYLRCGPHTFLFTGDMETGAIERVLRTGGVAETEVVKVPHHGARSSLSRQWAEQVRATAAVISVGRNNAYGHPAQEVMESYRRAGSALFRTDRDGAVLVNARLSSRELHIQTALDMVPHPVVMGKGCLSQEFRNIRKVWKAWLLT
jgi:competence protein ComEC